VENRGQPFAEIKPPLTLDAALAEASRCLFCYDAPCTRACPTHIDVPAFIKKIATGNLRGSARTILESNVLGASCARVCPTEVLCEGACVLNDLHSKPIKIGQLQRHATDWAMAKGLRPFVAGPRRPGRVAIIGAGPAGLACAAELLRLGHEAVIFEGSPLGGGLNTSGVAEYKMTPEFALREVGWLVDAGVQIKTGVRVGDKASGAQVTLDELEQKFDAIFVGVGLGRIGRLGIPGEELDGVVDAIDFIARLKLERGHTQVGRRVVVVGGGNTSIDCVTQAARLGAEEVTLVYRRGPEEMPAYAHEVELARQSGTHFVFLAQPVRVLGRGHVEAVELSRMRLGAPDASGRRRPEPSGETFTLACDMVIPATGQEPRSELLESLPGVKLDRGRVVVDERTMQTSNPRYFAGGDCVSGGQEVVNAVAEGKRAAAGMAAYIAKRGENARG
jgi:glutamate synthase (NADPH/NADH) small chain